MTKSKSIYAAMIAVIIILAISGCGKNNEPSAAVMGDTNIRKAVTVANPQAAVDEVYTSLDTHEAIALDNGRIENLLGLKESDVLEYYGQISNPNEGLADVIILKPKESNLEDIQLALSKYKEKRISEFENYDILDAYSISQNAVIYNQGDYVIMLMLSDNDSARKIIDEYIPL